MPGSDELDAIQVMVPGTFFETNSSGGNRVVNRPEVDAIVEKIAACCADDRYSGKTMGVVVLQGEAQARMIETRLLERIGAEEIERRRIVCGNPYSFQGDERDVMFLSMMAAPNERIGPFTKAADERRFNVAASRARDQMFLFHSATCDELSSSCLRRRLLGHFQSTEPKEIGGVDRNELERRAVQVNRAIESPPSPFDSWFEVDVALELVRKGFDICPQYEFAGKRIDLVVFQGGSQLAVECDGDKWHGPDKYEEDMDRQRQLERCGWEFIRVRESAFYSNKDAALERLWELLAERGIAPGLSECAAPVQSRPTENENGRDEQEASRPYGRVRSRSLLPEDDLESFERDEARMDSDIPHPTVEVSASVIQAAILRALSQCPNQSCTIKSITGRVLKELGIVTRGNPRRAFERRVLRNLDVLEKQERVEKYKAKNRRIRLRSAVN